MGWGIGDIFTDPIGTISKGFSDLGNAASNPLGLFNNPSGNSLGFLVDPIGYAEGQPSYQDPYVDMIGTGVATYFGGPLAGAAVSGLTTKARGGSNEQALGAGAMTYAGGTLAGAGSSGTDSVGSSGQGLQQGVSSDGGFNPSGAGTTGFQGTAQSTGFGGSAGGAMGAGAGSAAGGGYGSTSGGGQLNTGGGNMDLSNMGSYVPTDISLGGATIPSVDGFSPGGAGSMGLTGTPDTTGFGPTPAQGSSLWDQLTQKMGNMGWKDWGKVAMGGLQMYGGYQNYQLAQQQLKQQQDYQNQLNALQTNPSSIQNLPGYQAGLNAVQRSMAAQGYQGSGNMAGAVSNYGMNIYNQQFANLSNLANQRVSSPYSGLMQMGAGAMSWF